MKFGRKVGNIYFLMTRKQEFRVALTQIFHGGGGQAISPGEVGRDIVGGGGAGGGV